jgi:hypothetical protein
VESFGSHTVVDVDFHGRFLIIGMKMVINYTQTTFNLALMMPGHHLINI